LIVLARIGRRVAAPSTVEEEKRRGGLKGRKARVHGTRQQHPATATHERSLTPRFRLDDDDEEVGEGMVVAVGLELVVDDEVGLRVGGPLDVERRVRVNRAERWESKLWRRVLCIECRGDWTGRRELGGVFET